MEWKGEGPKHFVYKAIIDGVSAPNDYTCILSWKREMRKFLDLYNVYTLLTGS